MNKTAQMPASAFNNEENRAISEESLFENFKIIGENLPFIAPNIPRFNEMEDLSKIIGTSDSKPEDWLCGALCSFTGIGSYYFYKKLVLIPNDSYGFTMNSGKPQLLRPGWHFLASPFNLLHSIVKIATNPLILGPITIVRISQGCIGFAMNNTQIEILLPGTHCKNSGTYRFVKEFQLNNELIQFKQVKILTILTGFVQICY